MFKNIFKAAKNLVKSPVGQLGISLLAPQVSFLKGVSPALLAGGIGLLGGAKPEDVLRGVALGAGTAALTGGMTGRGGVSEFFMGQPQVAKQIAPAIQNIPQGGSISFGEAPAMGFGINATTPTSGANMTGTIGGAIESAVTEGPGFLERFGLVKDTKIITNPDGSQSVVPVTDFFEKYSPLLKLGTVGASIAAAALGEEEARAIYDPEKNPYLTGQVKITDAYTPAGFAKGGGISDFPEKDGMINGPGDGQSDDIPAMLSDGEFVMTKQAVMAAGNGDRKQGTKAMYNIMNSLEDKAESMGIGRL
jgi:hypothetical protein